MHIRNNDRVFVENVYYPYLGDLHRPAAANGSPFRTGTIWTCATLSCGPPLRPRRRRTAWTARPFPSIRRWTTRPCFPLPWPLTSGETGFISARRSGAWRRRPGTQKRCRLAKLQRFPALFRGPGFWHGRVYPFRRSAHALYRAKTEFDLLPFALEGYRGRWETGAACYTRISGDWDAQAQNKYVCAPAGRRSHAWLQVQLNSPEDELRIPFRELPKIGEECSQYGIGALQVTGWNIGGQDRGNPRTIPTRGWARGRS